jgi:CRP-like cAMP-binding protein
MRSTDDRPANKLLCLLEPPSYERLAPKLTPTTLQTRQILYRPEEPIRTVYFTDSTVICQMTVMKNGDTIETVTVGLEGASWISASTGAPSMPCETIVAIGGDAHALDIDELDREERENDLFRQVLTQYSHALLIQSMRLTACTGLHTLQERCARWMLMTLDRVPANRFSITHEFLAMLLGASRPAVSAVIEDFKRRGILKGEGGRILVGDRDGLLAVSCECYEIITRHYEQVGRE